MRGRSCERADPQRDDLEPELVRVDAPERLRERLRGAVEPVGPRRRVAVEPLADAVEAGRAAGAGDDHAAHAGAPRGVVDVERAVQVRPGEHVERRLVGRPRRGAAPRRSRPRAPATAPDPPGRRARSARPAPAAAARRGR